MTIAATIHNQIKTIDARALWAWGAKDLVAMSTGLRFKTSGMVRWKGYVNVILDEGKDLYRVEFQRVRKANVITDKVVEDVFVEDLVSVIEAQVG